MIGFKQKYQDLFFQTEQTVNRKKSGFRAAPVKVYKKVVKFSFTQQKKFWVLVFSFMYLVSVDPMDKS